eukprot:TRINITY_DN6183_c0_g2_i1.p1 TRINITY_DN6183_c0_g2~~TRINITY_DN6183_c0_g2_i1.p1  ORF type:complete len:392 (-),score=56.36 TRINITY_DN6183_c0_g2_i1:528-1703(-)
MVQLPSRALSETADIESQLSPPRGCDVAAASSHRSLAELSCHVASPQRSIPSVDGTPLTSSPLKGRPLADEEGAGLASQVLTWIGLAAAFAAASLMPIFTVLSKEGMPAVPYIASTVIMVEGLTSIVLGLAVYPKLPTWRLLQRYVATGALGALGDILGIMALNYMDASLFNVILQGRLVLSAFTSWPVLGTSPGPVEWMGVGVISFGLLEYTMTEQGRYEGDEGDATRSTSQLTGVMLAVGNVVFKVLGSLYQEKACKQDKDLPVVYQSALISAGKVVPSIVWVLVDARSSAVGEEAWFSLDNIFHGWGAFTVALTICTLARNLLGDLVTKRFSSVVKYVMNGFTVPAVYLLQAVFFGDAVRPGYLVDCLTIAFGVYIYARGKSFVHKDA